MAEQVGITHAGVLHHFGSKEQLLVEVLEYRDKEDVRDLEGQHIPDGIQLFQHLVRTARMNVERRGIVQGYTVLTGESVTEDHPARDWVTNRFTILRGEIQAAIVEVGGGDVPQDVAAHAASAIIGVMDGLQVQWLLDDGVDLPAATQFAIEAILTAALLGTGRPHPPTAMNAPRGCPIRIRPNATCRTSSSAGGCSWPWLNCPTTSAKWSSCAWNRNCRWRKLVRSPV